jgi:hypothetical protein
MKTLFKVDIYKNSKFIGTGEFVLEKDYECEANDQFSFVSNIRDFYGHDTRQNLNGYKYIFAFVDYEDVVGCSFNEIMNFDALDMFKNGGYKLVLAGAKKTRYEEIEL